MSNDDLSKTYYPFVSVIILNWNGFEDTLECFQSLAHCHYPNFEVVLVDNASEDGTVKRLRNVFSDNEIFKDGRTFVEFTENTVSQQEKTKIPVKIIQNNENTGFSKGNNIGIADALKRKPDYILLLNNDTIVEKDFLNKLVDFLEKNKKIDVATPQIRYYHTPEKIWNCGGRLTLLYNRKYFYDGKFVRDLPDKDYLNISFITGCALFVRTSVIEKYGMLSEAFFFGEEDFEYSLRLKKNDVKAACVLKSVIYHKVNASVAKTSEFVIGKIFIHYLNRFINLRNFLSMWKWLIWRRFYLLYIKYLLRKKHNIPKEKISVFTQLLIKESEILDGVDRNTFEKYVNFDFSKSEPV